MMFLFHSSIQGHKNIETSRVYRNSFATVLFCKIHSALFRFWKLLLYYFFLLWTLPIHLNKISLAKVYI